MTSALYVYGLVRAGDVETLAPAIGELSAVAGGGAPGFEPLGPLAALASPLPPGAEGAELLPTRRNLLAHARALEACLPETPVLPVGFGLVSPGRTALAQTLAPREAELVAALDRFDGLAEFGLRISVPREAALAEIARTAPAIAREIRALAGAGQAAHYRRIELGRRVADALAAARASAETEMVTALTPHVHEIRSLPAEEDVEVLRAAVLLPLDGQSRFEAALEAASGALRALAPGADAQIRLVGPAPVSSFFTLRIADAPAPAVAG